MSRRPIPEAIQRRIVHCIVKQGKSVRQTARECRCGTATVQRYVRKHRQERGEEIDGEAL